MNHRSFKMIAAGLRFVLLAACLIPAALLAQAPSPLPPTPPRPGAAEGPTKVGYAVWIGDITRIDSVAQTFSASFVVVLRWRDPSLAHAGPGAKQFALADIWHPRPLITNETADTEGSLPEVADVAPDGTAVFRQRYIGSFSQSLNLRSFPFDSDTFDVHLVSLGNRRDEVQFAPDDLAIAAGMPEGVGVSDQITMQDWKVTAFSARPLPYHITPTVELAGFTFEFTAARRANHFVIKVIIPLILIVAMSWAVFWIEPSDSGSQYGLAVTAMLTLIAYRFAIDADVPKLPYLTRLDAFVLMSSLLVFLSLLEVMVTTKLSSRDRTDLARTIDRRCRWAFPLVFVIVSAVILTR